MHDAIGVNIECHFDLWHTTWCRWQVNKLELAKCLVVASHFTLTLEDVNFYRRLHVISSCKHFCASCWDSGVALDQLSHYATLGFNTK